MRHWLLSWWVSLRSYLRLLGICFWDADERSLSVESGLDGLGHLLVRVLHKLLKLLPVCTQQMTTIINGTHQTMDSSLFKRGSCEETKGLNALNERYMKEGETDDGLVDRRSVNYG
ncbi:unnamed protein product, partial [Vitis vinifera]